MVCFYGLAHDGQSQTSAAGFVRHKGIENFFQIFRRYTTAGISDSDNNTVLFFPGLQTDGAAG